MFRIIHMSKTGSSLVRFTVSQSLKASTAVHVGGHHAPAAAEFNRLEAYPRIGKREVVGYGRNSDPSYFDAPDCPCPAVRWSEETEEIRKLREKAKGDWAALSIADKKALYRADFRQTIAEATAPTGEWKFTFGLLLSFIGGAIWFYYIFAKLAYNYPGLDSSSLEHQNRMLERMLALGVGRVHGIASQWDYEKGDWKSK